MTAAGQSYSQLSKNRRWRIEIPEHNNRESISKSRYFQFGCYIPPGRWWLNHRRCLSLPPYFHPDAINIQKEPGYMYLKRRINKCEGTSLAENLPGKVPTVKWNSHKRFPQEPCIFHHFAKCYDPHIIYPCSFSEALDSLKNPVCQQPLTNCCTWNSPSCYGILRKP
ncbi:hypothetical protein Aperf_G00000068103 [Anoplocephala perfoliata]